MATNQLPPIPFNTPMVTPPNGTPTLAWVAWFRQLLDRVGGNIAPTLDSLLVNPMSNVGDMIYGGEGGTPNALSGSTSATKKFLTQTGTGAQSAEPSWNNISATDVPTLNQNTTGTAANITATTNATLTTLSALSLPSSQVTGLSGGTAPTVQKFLSGSGTYTTPTNPAPLYLRLILQGGGGGGGGGGTAASAPGTGGTGGTSSFGTSLHSCTGGTGGTFNGADSVGGTPTIGAGGAGLSYPGQLGSFGGFGYPTATGFWAGGMGGAGPLGGAVGTSDATSAGIAGLANTGAGGGGGGSTSTGLNNFGGNGGASGAWMSIIISGTLASTYAYVVGAGGAGGTAGTDGNVGGAGGAGLVYVEEHY